MKDGIEDEALPEQPLEVAAIAEDEVPRLIPASAHGHGHEHKTGIPWLDAIIAVSVVFISMLSLVVSIEHGKSMERMVEQNQKLVVASTLPLLETGVSELDLVTNKPRLRLFLQNDGVGPAVIDRFEIRYKGIAYHGPVEILRACCATALPKGSTNTGVPGVVYSNISGLILPPRETIEAIVIRPDKAGNALYDAFDKARNDIGIRACYCSVLDECWETDFGHRRPQPVKQCTVSPGEKLW
jgi:hypothetical protein